MSNNIITDSLEYYDKNTEKYEYLFKNVKYIVTQFNDTDTEHSSFHMFDANNSEIFRSRIETIGVYDNALKIWTWAWSIPDLPKNATYISRKMLFYGLDLEPNNKFLRSELITSRFRISSNIQIDLHLAIASYLSKKPVIFKIYQDVNVHSQSSKMTDITVNPTSENYFINYYFILDYDK